MGIAGICNNEEADSLDLSDGFDKDGISIWSPEEYTFNNYVSSIGTLNYISVFPRIKIRYNDGQTVNVEWKINSKTYESIEDRKDWKADIQKWETSFISSIDIKSSFNFGDKIEARICIDNEVFERGISVKENKIVADIYDLKWQMSKSEVMQKESYRIKGNFELTEISPTMLYVGICYNMNSLSSATVYTFEKDKLIEVAEYEHLTYDKQVPKDFVSFCKQLGFEKELILDNGKLKESHSWNNGKVEFKIHHRDDNLLQDYIGISYRPYSK
ncbi:hypothetical protein D0T84_19255 [Dysgonomonas sp. 521]|nr:hypothetical protein [Dysgonomonas sp. 521]